MLTLVLTRHGLTDRSEPEQHLGQRIDIGLSVAGQAQAEALAGRIGGERFDRIIASPLRRALQTARVVAAGRAVETDQRLAEMDYGRWEGQTNAALEERDGELRRRWVETPDAIPCPGGESGNDVARRADAFLEELLDWAEPAGPDERVVLAVAHSTFNRILLAVALDLPVRHYRRRFAQGQANLTVVRWDAGASPFLGRLLVCNDTAHLAAPGQAPWELGPGA
jgi:uncharacterized phosphatase